MMGLLRGLALLQLMVLCSAADPSSRLKKSEADLDFVARQVENIPVHHGSVSGAGRTFKAVIFDYGGVLTNGDVKMGFLDAEREYGLPPGTIVRCGFEGGVDSLVNRLDRGEITIGEAFPIINDMIKNKTEIDVDLSHFLPAMANYLAPSDLMVSVVQRLRRAGYKLGIVSNSWKISESPGDNFLLLDSSLFDAVVVSSDVGIRKPDREIFQLTLEKLAVTAEETIFLDDVSANLEAAKELGMTTIDVDLSDKSDSVEELGDLLQLDLNDQ